MAIEAQYLGLLKQAIDRGRASKGVLRGLLFAYPDLVVPRAALARMLGETLVASLPERADSAALWKYHGLEGVGDPMFDSVALLRSLGVEPVVIDVAAHSGLERIVDLNRPLPQDLARAFDLVVDTGTCEHCFNVAQAFVNACEALCAGGILVHAAPLNRVNHGFWSFNPTIYPDFFEANGFELQVMTGVTGTLGAGMRFFPVEAFGHFQPPADSALYVVARRREILPLKWPVQRKYQGMIR
jgi:hypothetical protein